MLVWLQAKKAHLWEQMNRYGMREKLLLADKVRKFIFASKVARRLKVSAALLRIMYTMHRHMGPKPTWESIPN